MSYILVAHLDHMEKRNFLSNKDLVAELQICKNTYSSYTDKEYSRYDGIVSDLEKLTPDFVEQTLAKKKDSVARKGSATWTGSYPEGPYDENHLVFRVMTEEHVPDDPDGRIRKKGTSGTTTKIRTNFPPYKHYILRDGAFIEVGRSHWKGPLDTGTFCQSHGRMTDKLGMMFMLLVERYARRGEYRGYSYNDEMRGFALEQLAKVGLAFDESKQEVNNPFAYFTQCVKNNFRRVLNNEKKVQELRDDLLIMDGAAPSFSRQLDDEAYQKGSASFNLNKHIPASVPDAPKKRGRKPKVAQ